MDMGSSAMKFLRLAFTATVLLLSSEAVVHAQSTLRIGIAQDPDALDPSISRTYVGRIVFAAFCDKLFDIDEKLNIVPQLALSHETSADGKEMTIKLRSGVKFHDGEPFDAEAAKFSIERHLTLPASFRKPELATVDHVDVVDPLTIKLVLKSPFAPLIAQLTDRAGMMMSPINSLSACSRTAWCSKSSPITGTRTTSSSIAWCFCPSSILPCGSPI
jgi:peptide/nickel transport system substrate-binding protein